MRDVLAGAEKQLIPNTYYHNILIFRNIVCRYHRCGFLYNFSLRISSL